MDIDIQFLRLVFCFSMLLFSSYYDVKTREVPDKLWIFFAIIGVLLYTVEYFAFTTTHPFWLILISITVTILISTALYYLGFYGGADAKALITLSILLPLYHPQVHIHPFTSITTLSNSVFITVIIPMVFILKNLIRVAGGEKIFEGFESESFWRKLLASFLGYRSKGKVGSFQLSLEEIKDGRRRFRFSMLKKDEDFVDSDDTWVTPGIPMLVFITAGFIIMLLYGDILTAILKTFMQR